MVTRRTDLAGLMLHAMRGLLIVALPLTVVYLWATHPQPPLLDQLPAVVADYTLVESAQHELSWYAPLWQRDLKQPPIPPMVVTQPVEPQLRGQVPTLIATCITPDGRYAHFVDGNGKTRLAAVDQKIDAFTVAAIEPGRVRLVDTHGAFWSQVPNFNVGGGR